MTGKGRLPPGLPMTLANMRENRVRSLKVTCLACHHTTAVNMDAFDAARNVQSFGRQMRCTKCGTLGCEVRPNWIEAENQPSDPAAKRY
jgi:hypothetical protein